MYVIILSTFYSCTISALHIHVHPSFWSTSVSSPCSARLWLPSDIRSGLYSIPRNRSFDTRVWSTEKKYTKLDTNSWRGSWIGAQHRLQWSKTDTHLKLFIICIMLFCASWSKTNLLISCMFIANFVQIGTYLSSF